MRVPIVADTVPAATPTAKSPRAQPLGPLALAVPGRAFPSGLRRSA